jgi:hypothetical protein
MWMRAWRVVGALVVIAAMLHADRAAATVHPPNDNFANAKAITGFPADLPSETNVGATEETNEPGVGPSYAGASVWYRWTAPASRDYDVSLCASPADFDPAITVYTGSTLTTLEWATGTSPSCTSGGLLSHALFLATSGTQYYIQVAGFDDPDTGYSQSAFDLKIDNGPGGLYFVDSRAPEGDSGRTSMKLRAVLGVPKAHDVTFHWQTIECEICSYIASEGTDYVTSSGDVVIPAGKRGGKFTVPIIGDTTVENDEAFWISLSHAQGARIKRKGGVGVIVNDD